MFSSLLALFDIAWELGLEVGALGPIAVLALE
jgi:hypothetical protein